MMLSYDNFFLPVDNIKEAQVFYGEKLGLPLKFAFEEKGMMAFSVGAEEPAIILKDKTTFTEAKPTIWFVTSDVMEKYTQLKNEDITFLSDPYPIGTGTAVEFEDGFGNRLGITAYKK